MYIILKEDRVKGATHTIYFCENSAFEGLKSDKWKQAGWYSSSQGHMFHVDAPQRVWAAIRALPSTVGERAFIDEMQLLPLPNDDVEYGQRKLYRNARGETMSLTYRPDISIDRPWMKKDGVMRFGSVEEANSILSGQGFKEVVSDRLSNTLVIAGLSLMTQALSRHPVPEEAIIVEDALIAMVRGHEGALIVIDKSDEPSIPSDRAGALLALTVQSALAIRKHDKRSGLYSSTWSGKPISEDISASVGHLIIDKFQTAPESSIRFLALPECIEGRETSQKLNAASIDLLRHFGLPDVEAVSHDKPRRPSVKRAA